MHLEKSIGIILMMYHHLHLNAAAMSSSGGKWLKCKITLLHHKKCIWLRVCLGKLRPL